MGELTIEIIERLRVAMKDNHATYGDLRGEYMDSLFDLAEEALTQGDILGKSCLAARRDGIGACERVLRERAEGMCGISPLRADEALIEIADRFRDTAAGMKPADDDGDEDHIADAGEMVEGEDGEECDLCGGQMSDAKNGFCRICHNSQDRATKVNRATKDAEIAKIRHWANEHEHGMDAHRRLFGIYNSRSFGDPCDLEKRIEALEKGHASLCPRCHVTSQTFEDGDERYCKKCAAHR